MFLKNRCRFFARALQCQRQPFLSARCTIRAAGVVDVQQVVEDEHQIAVETQAPAVVVRSPRHRRADGPFEPGQLATARTPQCDRGWAAERLQRDVVEMFDTTSVNFVQVAMSQHVEARSSAHLISSRGGELGREDERDRLRGSPIRNAGLIGRPSPTR